VKLGIALNDIGANQLAFYILRQLYDKSLDCDVIAFYNILHKPCILLNIATMHISEMWNYDGIVIATNYNCATKLLKAPGPSKKYFYIWNLEWRVKSEDYISMSQVYCNPNLELISRSKEHQWIIKNCWNRDSKICDNVNLNKLLEIIDGY